MSLARPIVALALLVFGAACTGNPAPSGWLAKPLAAANDAYGAWIALRFADTTRLSGEFLGVDRDTVFVLALDSAVYRVPAESVRTATVAWYDSNYETLAWWGALGTLSTLSHGFVLIFSMPIWSLASLSSAGSESRAPLARVEKVGWAGVRQYARFPAGVPADLPVRLPVKPPAPRVAH